MLQEKPRDKDLILLMKATINDQHCILSVNPIFVSVKMFLCPSLVSLKLITSWFILCGMKLKSTKFDSTK